VFDINHLLASTTHNLQKRNNLSSKEIFPRMLKSPQKLRTQNTKSKEPTGLETELLLKTHLTNKCQWNKSSKILLMDIQSQA